MKTKNEPTSMNEAPRSEDLSVKFEFEFHGAHMTKPVRITNSFSLSQAQHASHASSLLGDFEEIFALLVAKPCKLAVIREVRNILDELTRKEHERYERKRKEKESLEEENSIPKQFIPLPKNWNKEEPCMPSAA